MAYNMTKVTLVGAASGRLYMMTEIYVASKHQGQYERETAIMDFDVQRAFAEVAQPLGNLSSEPEWVIPIFSVFLKK